MKPDIHPDNYRTVLFYDSGADQDGSSVHVPIPTGKPWFGKTE